MSGLESLIPSPVELMVGGIMGARRGVELMEAVNEVLESGADEVVKLRVKLLTLEDTLKAFKELFGVPDSEEDVNARIRAAEDAVARIEAPDGAPSWIGSVGGFVASTAIVMVGGALGAIGVEDLDGAFEGAKGFGESLVDIVNGSRRGGGDGAARGDVVAAWREAVAVEGEAGGGRMRKRALLLANAAIVSSCKCIVRFATWDAAKRARGAFGRVVWGAFEGKSGLREFRKEVLLLVEQSDAARQALFDVISIAEGDAVAHEAAVERVMNAIEREQKALRHQAIKIALAWVERHMDEAKTMGGGEGRGGGGGGEHDGVSEFAALEAHLPPDMMPHDVAFAALHADAKTLIKRCVEHGGVGWVVRDGDGKTLVKTALDDSSWELLLWLLRRGASFGSESECVMAMFSACRASKQEKIVADVVGLLLDRGADMEARDEHRRTPLHCAALSGHSDVVVVLLDRGVDTEAKCSGGASPLHIAARYGHSGVVRVLVDRGADMETKDSNGWTPLHMAAIYGNTDVVNVLLDGGADKEGKDILRRTPLHWAALHGNINVIGVLLDRGADMEAESSGGSIPLHMAAMHGHSDVVKLLLDHGAVIEAKDNGGRTPISRAADSGHSAVVELLLDRGADIHARDREGRMPHHMAALKGHFDVVRVLLRCGADVMARDEHGRTVMHYVGIGNHSDVAELLLERDADIDARDNSGNTPLSLARDPTAQLLRSRGAHM